MLRTHLQPGKLHFLLSGEVFSGFFILTPFNEKAAKVSYLPLRLKDSLIFYIICLYHNYCDLSNDS
jgi:hypothetical protein